VTATSWEIGWEVMVVLIVLFVALLLLGLIALIRSPRSHHLRVGFFVERDDQLAPEDEIDIPPSADEAPTREWPIQK
jgi:hypothetical protein